MTTPAPLTIDKHTGRLHRPDQDPHPIEYNNPWPLKFARGGVTGNINGVLLHTVVGTYEACIATFNAANPGGSAHFVVAQDGRIHQFVPIGQGYETYHAYAANLDWYGIETEDMGNPHIPISDKGLDAWAQLYEFLAGFAGFPLEVTDKCNGHGLAYHRMCPEWNLSHHSCPGASMTDMVRVNQRAEIIKRAKAIRAAAAAPAPFPSGRHVVSDNPGTLAALAKLQGVDVADIWFATFTKLPTKLGDLQRQYLNSGQWDHKMPAGMVLWLP
jgi:N-acetylmuramoyl-L-alanine amidase